MSRPTLPVLGLWALIAVTSACSDSGDLASPRADFIRVQADTRQSVAGLAGEAVEPAPAVRLTTGAGTPAEGVLVTFEVVDGGGAVLHASVTSNAEGRASLGAWVLGDEPGTNTLRASIVGGTPSSLQFSGTGVRRCPPPCATAGRLAFVRDGDIHVALGDGSELVQLTQGGGFGEPAWSPDGLRLAFEHTGTVGSPPDLYLMEADGSQIGYFASGWSPAWSPDGRLIAYAGLADGQGAIFVRSVDGVAPVLRLGHERGRHESPTWSPDGSRIAFVSDWMGFDFALDVYVARVEDNSIVQLTNGFMDNVDSWPSYMIYAQPAWSPDGTRLAVVACEEWQFFSCERSSVGTLRADDGTFTILSQTTGFAAPGWLSDGETVVFARTCWAHDCPSSVFAISASGGSDWLLVQDAHSPAWRP